MKRVIAVLLVTIVACACPSKATKTGGGSGSGTAGSGSAVSAPVGGCDGARAKVEQLYRAEAQAKEPKRVEEAVADNTAMVLAECAKDPAKGAVCIASAPTLADLEANCMPKLDDEGTEGDALKH